MKKVTNNLTHKQYNRLSQNAYDIESYKLGVRVHVGDNQYMYVVDYTTKNKQGTNAITLVSKEDYLRSNHGKNFERIKDIYIAYRGSEPISGNQAKSTMDLSKKEKDGEGFAQRLIGLSPFARAIEKFSDGGVSKATASTAGAVKYANEILQDWVTEDYNNLIRQRKFDKLKDNQPKEANKYANKMHEKYGTANVHLTGHSLAGTDVTYILVNNDWVTNAVTFENPNAFANLPKDIQEKAKNGEYRDRLTEYLNLNDGLSLLNRQFPDVGKVLVMWDESLENVDMSMKGKEYMTNQGLQLTNESLNINLFMEAIKGSHQLKRYSFHKDGSIITLQEKLRKNPQLLHAMFVQAASTHMNEQGAPLILLKTILLKEIADKFHNEISEYAEDLIKAVTSIDTDTTYSALETKSMFTRMVGFGEYDLLTVADVEEVFRELALSTDKGDHLFFNLELFEDAMHSAMVLKDSISKAGNFTEILATQIIDGDKNLAATMGTKQGG